MRVRVERQGPVTTVVLARPQVANAVDRQTAQELVDAFAAFEADDGAHAAVLCGDGPNFCGSADLKQIAAGDPNRLEPDGDGPMGPSRMLLSKPVVAAIGGHAVAGGLELALWCDLRIADEDAVLGVFCRRWGVPLIDGGTVRLPRIVGQGRALDLILTGRPVGAAEALAIGLANRVVPAGSARAEAARIAAEIARFPSLCMRTDRASAYAGWDSDVRQALQAEALAGAAPLAGGAREGAARFAAGRGRAGDFEEI
jgi:enoyl-CoA hydratase